MDRKGHRVESSQWWCLGLPLQISFREWKIVAPSACLKNQTSRSVVREAMEKDSEGWRWLEPIDRINTTTSTKIDLKRHGNYLMNLCQNPNYFATMSKLSRKRSLKDIWCLSPPNITIEDPIIVAVWPSLAHGLLPWIMFIVELSGYRKREQVVRPKSVRRCVGFLSFVGLEASTPDGLALPMMSREFFIACVTGSTVKYFCLSFSPT